jgi:hypothetical protein
MNYNPLNLGPLNAICPYFTMFPIEFPLRVLTRNPKGLVVDPFCGRGTTNLAARSCGLPTIGVDSSPVAVAATSAKLSRAKTNPDEIVKFARTIIETRGEAEVPAGEFWSLAYDKEVLQRICLLRSALINNCRSDVGRALRAIMLGALHGPRLKNGGSSYFSNQAPRTYAPKPRYAVQFWRRERLQPPHVDVLSIIRARAERAFHFQIPPVRSRVKLGDSRAISWGAVTETFGPISWIITSPPYYGLRTYRQDQWLREWFLGGPSAIQYYTPVQICHSSQEDFVNDLRTVWNLLAEHAASGAHLVFRFGSINDRPVNARSLALQSVCQSGWRVRTISPAGLSTEGRRQAVSFVRGMAPAIEEIDVWCVRR